MIKQAGELEELAFCVLVAAGATESNARCVAAHLVGADLCGVETHGLWHLSGYVTAIKSRELVPDARPEILKEDATSALISGNWTFGQVAATLAMEKAITKAAQKNVSVVGLVQIHHVGRLGEYVETAAAHGMASMIWAGGFSEEAPAAVPYGGRKRVLHTNPISMGFPTGEEPPVMFDFATSVTSQP